jgi:DeoR family fructose operon transcriptional repressor
VTNSVTLASQIADSSTKTYMLSGRVRPTTLSSVGARTVEDLSQLNAVVAFVGANGISKDLRITAFDTDEALVKKGLHLTLRGNHPPCRQQQVWLDVSLDVRRARRF